MSAFPKEFGKYSYDQLAQLIELVNSLFVLKASLFDEFKSHPEKLRLIVDNDFRWFPRAAWEPRTDAPASRSAKPEQSGLASEDDNLTRSTSWADPATPSTTSKLRTF
jgi:hypothetical protein